MMIYIKNIQSYLNKNLLDQTFRDIAPCATIGTYFHLERYFKEPLNQKFEVAFSSELHTVTFT